MDSLDLQVNTEVAIDYLAARLAQAEKEVAIAAAKIEALQAKIVTLFSDDGVTGDAN